VHYAPDRTPWIEAKIQELFGWPDTPRIAAGRVRLQLHLLGPNYRPEQITEDLANFWKVTYAQVRKDLRGRYPKHHWPEDPTTATATPRGMKPK
jgi:ATP-dependent helicase HrpB